MGKKKISHACPAFKLSALATILMAAGTHTTPASEAARICLAPADAEVADGDPTQAVVAVSATFTTFLTGPSLGVFPLTARLESQVREEARLAECPYLLLTSLTHTRKTGGGLFSRLAAGAVREGAWSAAANATSPVGRAAASAAAGAAGEASWGYGVVKTKDEVALTYRLEASNGAVLVENTTRRAADSDGEDLLTPLIAEASEAIAAALVSTQQSTTPEPMP